MGHRPFLSNREKANGVSRTWTGADLSRLGGGFKDEAVGAGGEEDGFGGGG
jgi:hypothetical protein